jgi:hypothetical protein
MWNIRASINNIIHFRRYKWCLNYARCLLSQSLWTSGIWCCTIWYTRTVSAAYLTKISGTTSWITTILMHIAHETSNNRNNINKQSDMLICGETGIKQANTRIYPCSCWLHAKYHTYENTTHSTNVGKVANNHNSFYVVKFYCNMFQLMCKKPSLDWQGTQKKLSCRTSFIIFQSVCLQPRSQFTIS